MPGTKSLPDIASTRQVREASVLPELHPQRRIRRLVALSAKSRPPAGNVNR